jgi:hypothetical protein
MSHEIWETKKGTLALDGPMVSMTIGRKIETMALADLKSVEAGH